MNERTDHDDRDDDPAAVAPEPGSGVEDDMPPPEPSPDAPRARAPDEDPGEPLPEEPHEDVPRSAFRQVWGTDPPRARRSARQAESRTRRVPPPPTLAEAAAPADDAFARGLGASLESMVSRTEESERKLDELAREVRDLAAAVRQLAGDRDAPDRVEQTPRPARAGGLAAEVERLLRGERARDEDQRDD